MSAKKEAAFIWGGGGLKTYIFLPWIEVLLEAGYRISRLITSSGASAVATALVENQGNLERVKKSFEIFENDIVTEEGVFEPHPNLIKSFARMVEIISGHMDSFSHAIMDLWFLRSRVRQIRQKLEKRGQYFRFTPEMKEFLVQFVQFINSSGIGEVHAPLNPRPLLSTLKKELMPENFPPIP